MRHYEAERAKARKATEARRRRGNPLFTFGRLTKHLDVFDAPSGDLVRMRRAHLAEAKERMVEYLQLKIAQEDWHGVQDAASDLRDIEAELKGLDFADPPK